MCARCSSVDFISSKLTESGLPGLLAYGVYVGEILAPLMIIIGIFSRVGGLILVINMLFAILLVHAGDILALTDHGGWRLELQAFYLFGALAIGLCYLAASFATALWHFYTLMFMAGFFGAAFMRGLRTIIPGRRFITGV